MLGRDQQLAGLDQRFQGVGEARHDGQLDRGLAVVGAEAGRGVGDLGLRGAADDGGAELLQPHLERREVLDRVDLAVADDHVRLAGQHGGDQVGDVRRVVLVVGVGVDDHVGAELEAGVEPGLESRGETAVVRQLDDVVDAVGAGHLEGAVDRAVVDHQPLDGVEPRHLAREVGEGRREGLLLVETRDLDDQLHRLYAVGRWAR